jgi:hypothetical protein
VRANSRRRRSATPGPRSLGGRYQRYEQASETLASY